MALRFTPAFVEEIKAQSDIVAVISEHVALRRAGKDFVGLCPFHAEKTPSFTVSRDKQMFHCFGCQAGGDVITFMMRRTGSDFPTAVEELARRAGIDVSRFVASPEEQQKLQQRQRLLDIHREAATFFAHMLRTVHGRAARAYLQRRGIQPETVQRFQLGFAASGDLFRRFLTKRGIDEKLALEAGLLVPGRQGRAPFARFRERLMFPIWDRGGRVIGFGGRLLADGVAAPKYLNSPETPLFSKRNTLYAAHLAAPSARNAASVIVVEGYTDCISLFQHGIDNVVASLGTAFTEQQARWLARMADRAVVAFDADTAGEAATVRSLDLLASVGVRVSVVQLPSGQDPDEFVRERGPEHFRAAVRTALPLAEYKLNKVFSDGTVDTVEGRARAVEAAVGIVRRLESPVEREGYIQLIADRAGVSPDAVRAELRRMQGNLAKSGGSRHTGGKNRHNNRGFPPRGSEHTPRSTPAGGELLFHAEQVILRHVLIDERRTDELAALDRSGTWSGETMAAAAAMLQSRAASERTDRWLDELPDSAAATLLRTIWADDSLGDVPWDDACRELWRQRGRHSIAVLESRLQLLEKAPDPTKAFCMLVMLLVEYKRLRSLLGEQAQH